MKYILGISVLVWLNLHLGQAAVENNPGAGREKRIHGGYRDYRRPQDATCTDETEREYLQCAKNLITLERHRYPWSLSDISEIQNQIRNQQKQNGSFRDPLDPINHVCEVCEGFLKCLDQHAIPSECLLSSTGWMFRLKVVFGFICHKQPRSTVLLQSLQCLQDSRVLDLLVFHLADRIGTHLDDMAQGTVNAFFKLLNNGGMVYKYSTFPTIPYWMTSIGLTCLPESVISHDIAFIVNRRCGSHAADLVCRYYLYFRSSFNSILSKIGFLNNICDKETRRNPTIDRADTAPVDTPTGGIFSRLFDTFVEEKFPGTAMDTEYGAILRSEIQSLSDQEFCDKFLGVQLPFQACLYLSYNPSGKAKFNILQYAHAVSITPFTPYPDSSSLTIFHSCWNLVQQICGPNATYIGYTYHVSAGSREIQRMMDDLTCEWQDTLIRLYIEASENGNIWPTGDNGNKRPMFLSSGILPFGSLTNSMSDLISVVSRGVKEISAKCSLTSAKRIMLFYERIKYSWYDEIKFLYEMGKVSGNLP